MAQQYPYGSAPQALPNSSMAIVSLIAGILGITFIPFVGSIVALITGYMARKEIRESAGALGGDGLATAGLVLGWIGVGLGVLGICIGGIFILLPICLTMLGLGLSGYQSLLPVLLSLV
jgi:hypothetical protein